MTEDTMTVQSRIRRAPALPDGKPSLQQSPKLNTPVLRAHVDFSAKSGPRRLKDIMKDEAETLSKTPYGILQVRYRVHFQRNLPLDTFYSCINVHSCVSVVPQPLQLVVLLAIHAAC